MQGFTAEQREDRREVVAFRLGEQDFCIDIGFVREIRGWTPATVIPHAERCIKGVINLRGSVVAVVDLSARLDFGETTPSARHVIIIVSLGRQTVGLLAEVVSDILSVTPDMVKPVPEQLGGGAQGFISAILTLPDGRMLRALDLAQVLPQGAGL